MPARGRPWDRERSAFKRDCKRIDAACWLCRGAKGPIQYDAPPKHTLSFTADHVTPTSLGGDALRRANLKPAHY